MPHKKKRLFTKHNSTKFVLYTEGRNEDGEKIQQNVLVPVSSSHVPGSSLLFSSFGGICAPPIDDIPENDQYTGDTSKLAKNKIIETCEDEDGNLEKILDQMGDLDADSDDEDYENIRLKMEKIGLFQEPNSCHPSSNVQVEIFEEGSDFSDDFGQFSDAESDENSDLSPRQTLTSARSDCPESIKLLNEGFKKVFAEYENQVGALDDEEICGHLGNKRMLGFVKNPVDKKGGEIILDEFDESLKEKILLLTKVEVPEKIVDIKTEKPLEFDCESILSTYSNQYNHPTVIKEESMIRKITIPRNPLKKGLTKSQLKQLDCVSENEEDDDEDDRFSVATSCNIRVKNETPEQRRERKSLFKEAKRESRRLKKENKLAFKHEKKLQVSQAINAQNNKGIKLI